MEIKCPKCQADNYVWYHYCRDCCTQLEYSKEAPRSITWSLPTPSKKIIIDPEVFYSLRRMASPSASWKHRTEAWGKLREMGPTYQGWTECLQNIIYCGDGWSRIFAAEALSRFSCNPYDAVPVLKVLIEECLEEKDYGRGIIACGALENYKVLDTVLAEDVLPVLIRVIDETEGYDTSATSDKLNMRGYAIRALGNYGRLSEEALPKLEPYLERHDDPLWRVYSDTVEKIEGKYMTRVRKYFEKLDNLYL